MRSPVNTANGHFFKLSTNIILYNFYNNPFNAATLKKQDA